MVTKNKGDWLYGRFEIKAKLPKGQRYMARIMDAADRLCLWNWPNSGEIDIMEHVGYDQNKFILLPCQSF